VEREVNLCTIRTRGAVILVQGRIIGGEIRALGGIDCEQIGSDAYLRTVLVAGEDYTLRDKVTPIETDLQRLRESLSKIAEKLVPLKSRIKNLPPKLRELVTVLLDEGNKLREEIERRERELESVYNESRSRAKKEIVIRKRILPDVLFQVPPLSLLVKEEVEGPLKVAFHEGELHLLKTRVRR